MLTTRLDFQDNSPHSRALCGALCAAPKPSYTEQSIADCWCEGCRRGWGAVETKEHSLEALAAPPWHPPYPGRGGALWMLLPRPSYSKQSLLALTGPKCERDMIAIFNTRCFLPSRLLLPLTQQPLLPQPPRMVF